MANDPFDDDFLSDRRRTSTTRELSLRSELMQVRHELRTLLDDLDRLALASAEPVQSAVVTAVVPRAGISSSPPMRRDR